MKKKRYFCIKNVKRVLFCGHLGLIFQWPRELGLKNEYDWSAPAEGQTLLLISLHTCIFSVPFYTLNWSFSKKKKTPEFDKNSACGGWILTLWLSRSHYYSSALAVDRVRQWGIDFCLIIKTLAEESGLSKMNEEEAPREKWGTSALRSVKSKHVSNVSRNYTISGNICTIISEELLIS